MSEIIGKSRYYKIAKERQSGSVVVSIGYCFNCTTGHVSNIKVDALPIRFENHPAFQCKCGAVNYIVLSKNS